ncbi:sigma-70 family RNA polymerase sigma factor [Alkalicaulis satelles]|uniref:Sigma-70 family RNA polymerase sigma factor n=1 Tax=Alkalicaulis satelles TaxID=2609175 RepID=A0A5M6ZK15_9PROT|nr:sigma-70 family RNA polymerase sigma factor [Alkalicaulis satelles]KAA5803568.1 sigma-70 family RNA polymerase sigma factor [Alkalicaulis satelles]
MTVRRQEHKSASLNEVAISDLDRRFRRPLVAYFNKRIREQYDVDDLVQEVFLRLVRRAELSDVEAIDRYIFRTAANVIKDRSRRRSARLQHLHHGFDETEIDSDLFSPERVLLGKEALEQLAAALDAMPEKTRNVFMLRRYEGLKNSEIAALLGLTVSGVRFHIIRAKAYLARRLEDKT